MNMIHAVTTFLGHTPANASRKSKIKGVSFIFVNVFGEKFKSTMKSAQDTILTTTFH